MFIYFYVFSAYPHTSKHVPNLLVQLKCNFTFKYILFYLLKRRLILHLLSSTSKIRLASTPFLNCTHFELRTWTWSTAGITCLSLSKCLGYSRWACASRTQVWTCHYLGDAKATAGVEKRKNFAFSTLPFHLLEDMFILEWSHCRNRLRMRSLCLARNNLKHRWTYFYQCTSGTLTSKYVLCMRQETLRWFFYNMLTTTNCCKY